MSTNTKNTKIVKRSEILDFGMECAVTFKEGRLADKFEGVSYKMLASIVSSSIQLAIKRGEFGIDDTEVVDDVR